MYKRENDSWKPLFDLAMEKLGSSKSDLSPLPFELQVIVRIVSAQGIIGNGGYTYFFENDWEGQPPYSVFYEAYRAIGHPEGAADLERIVNTFPFADPHLHAEARDQFIVSQSDEDEYDVPGWGDLLCDDSKTVWHLLNQFCLKHQSKFGL